MVQKTLASYFGMEGPKDQNRFHVRLKCPLACIYPEKSRNSQDTHSIERPYEDFQNLFPGKVLRIVCVDHCAPQPLIRIMSGHGLFREQRLRCNAHNIQLQLGRRILFSSVADDAHSTNCMVSISNFCFPRWKRVGFGHVTAVAENSDLITC